MYRINRIKFIKIISDAIKTSEISESKAKKLMSLARSAKATAVGVFSPIDECGISVGCPLHDAGISDGESPLSEEEQDFYRAYDRAMDGELFRINRFRPSRYAVEIVD